jgi:hypothetical protein
MPSLSIRLCAVFQCISNSLAISSMVKPVINKLSDKKRCFLKNIVNIRHLLNARLVKLIYICKNIVSYRNNIVTIRYYYDINKRVAGD